MAHVQLDSEDTEGRRASFREAREEYEAEQRERAAQELAVSMIASFRRHSYGRKFEVPRGSRSEVLARAFEIMCSRVGRSVEAFSVEPGLPMRIRFYRNR